MATFLSDPLGTINNWTGGTGSMGLLGLGALTGGMNQQKDQTSTQVNTPWAPQQPYLQDIFSQGQNLYNQNLPLTPNLSAQTQQGMGLLGQASPLPGQYATDVLSGKYLDPSSDPYLQSTYNQAVQSANNAINSNFAGNNRYGSGAHNAAIASADTNLANNLFGGAYQQGIQNQLAVAGMAPGLLNYQANNALTAGGIQDQYNQQKAMDPYNRLAQYQGAVSGNYGGTTTQTNPIYRNAGAGLLGGALAGGKIGSMVPGLGTAWGAGIGGVLGLLG